MRFPHQHLQKAVLAALFAALTFVATAFITVPLPLGYVNLGDAFVLLGGLLLGPVYGALAGGIGAMLGDLMLGFAQYAPGTLLIKAVMALIAAGFGAWSAKYGKVAAFGLRAVGGALAEGGMVGGYLLFETVLYGFAGAAVSVPFNALQGAVGLALALLLYPLIQQVMKRTMK